MPPTRSVYTVGHSNHSTTALISLLRQHNITVVVDVRSQPYSRWAPQFNREALLHDLQEAGIAYRFMGDVLGGRPSDPLLYSKGEPDYGRMEESDVYRRGIGSLLNLARRERVALMCGEADHLQCHRHLLISQTLLKHGTAVFHIKPDGRLVEGERVPQQLALL